MDEVSMMAAQLARLQHAPPAHALLAVVVCTAAVIDWRTMRLPNWLTAGAMALGLFVNVFWPAPGMSAWWALAGLGAGLACTLPFYVLRVMGAGDVKLVAAVGAFLGVPSVFGAVVCTFIAGGIAAVAFAIWRRAFKRLAVNVNQAAQGLFYAALGGVHAGAILPLGSVGKLPYGLAICAGTLTWLALPALL